MKLRIRGNSIRIRVTKTEIANFGKHGFLEETTAFGGALSFGYSLRKKAGIDKLEAAYADNSITVFVPEKIVNEWTTTDIVGFENNMDLGNSKQLFLLIEKDFVCLDHSFEDQSDNFPNPNAIC